MSLFLAISTTTFNGSDSVTLRDKTDPSYPEDFTIYPKGRSAPIASWAILSQIAIGGYFTINSDKKLTVWNYANFDVIFSSSALAAAFGFSATTTSGSGGSTLIANTAITAYPVLLAGAVHSHTGNHKTGHGSGTGGAQGRGIKLEAVATRANAASITTEIEQNGYLSLADTGAGGNYWTMRIKDYKYFSAGLDKARLVFSGFTEL